MRFEAHSVLVQGLRPYPCRASEPCALLGPPNALRIGLPRLLPMSPVFTFSLMDLGSPFRDGFPNTDPYQHNDCVVPVGRVRSRVTLLICPLSRHRFGCSPAPCGTPPPHFLAPPRAVPPNNTPSRRTRAHFARAWERAPLAFLVPETRWAELEKKRDRYNRIQPWRAQDHHRRL
jgi:hypothetical protein